MAWSLGRRVLIVLVVVILISVVAVFFFGSETISRYYFNIGVKDFDSQNYNNSMKNLEKANFFYSENFNVHALLGRAYVAVNRSSENVRSDAAKRLYEKSIDEFNAALTLGLDNDNYAGYGDFLDDYATAYWRLGEYDKAVELFLKKIEKYPDSSFLARFLVALDYTERVNKPEEALLIISPAFESYNIIPSLLPDAFTVALRLSTYFKKLEDTKKYAQLIIQSAGSENKESLQFAYIHLATYYSMKGDLVTAQGWLLKADELLGQSDRHACVLAHMQIDHGKLDLAVNSASKRDEPRCWAALARAYFKLGDKTKAKTNANKTLIALKALEKKDIFTFPGIKEMENILNSL